MKRLIGICFLVLLITSLCGLDLSFQRKTSIMSKRSSLAGLADGSSHLKADMSRLSVIAPLQTSVRYTVTLTYLDFAGVRRPLVGVRVWMCDEEPSNQFRMLVELFTNTGGQCDSGNIPNTDPVDGGTLDIFFIFWAWNNVVQVVDPSYNTYIAYTSTYTNHPDGTYGLPVDFGNEAPWLILSFHNGLGAGWDYLNSQLGYQASMVTCVYPDGTLPFYLQLPVGEIHIPNGFGVPQAQIPDALLHEYAHFIMDNLYGFLPATQNPHFLNLVSDATTAWVEGWAEFFPMVVRNDPNSPGVNLETTSWYASGWDEGDTVEGRVAGALWDIFDSQNDVAPYYYDSFSDGLAHIWNIMQTTPCNTFAQFWQHGSIQVTRGLQQ